MAFQQYNIYPGFTPVRVVSTSNVSNTYFNGLTNNGVGATLTVAASSLTIDSVVVAVGDRVLLSAQTNGNENGIYVVLSIGTTVVLQRAADMQSIEQIRTGQFVSVGAGSVDAGNIYAIVEPLPAVFGVNNLVINALPTAGAVTFSGAASVANNIPVFADTAGNIKAQTATATLGFGLTISTGNFNVSAGNVVAGSSGNAGTVSSFPAAASNGSLILAAANNAGGNFNTTISNASSVGQSQVVSIPDGGSATSNFIISNSSGTQTIATGSLALTVGNVTATAGNLQAGSSGHAGTVTSFPGTAANGSLIMAAVNNASNFSSTISNSAVAQAVVYTLPDPSAATAQIMISQSNVPVNRISFTRVITAGFAALGTAGKINVVTHPSATSQFAVTDIKVLNSTGLSGGGGNRLLAVSDGTIVFNGSGITAALLGTPICTVWGGTGNPIASGTSQVSTAGADIFLQYTGGTTDYAAGSVQLAITLVQVTA